MPNKWLKELHKLDTAVDYEYDAFAEHNVIPMPTPSVGYLFANKSFGLPLGFSMTLWGEQESGKSILTSSIVGALHQKDENAIVVKFNTRRARSSTVSSVSAR